MAILNGIWFVIKAIGVYIGVIFPLMVATVMGVYTSYLVKAHFYDKQKLSILDELNWIGWKKAGEVKKEIDKEISSLVFKLIISVVALVVYFNFAGETSTTINIALVVIFLIGLGGDKVKEDTSMKGFMKEYCIDIQVENISNNET